MRAIKLLSLKNDKVIEFIHVKKSFGAQIVFQDISFSVTRGKVLSVMGPSGCGKTISIKMLIGLIEPDAGSILFDKWDIANIDDQSDFQEIRRRIAMVFQGAALFDSLSVFENIAYPLNILHNLNDSEINDKVHWALSLVGLPDAAEKMPNELSGGMKKRIGLARAIITKPEVILYDEPTAGLDPVNTNRILDLILMLEEEFKCTSIVISHDMPAIHRISHEVAFFYGGRVRQIGTFDELQHSADSIVSGFVLGNPDILLTTYGSL